MAATGVLEVDGIPQHDGVGSDHGQAEGLFGLVVVVCSTDVTLVGEEQGPRLSYRGAADLFTAHTGWTLHQLCHSALTHAAEDAEPRR